MKDHKELMQALLNGETLENESYEFQIQGNFLAKRDKAKLGAASKFWQITNNFPDPKDVEIKPKTILIGDIEVPEPLRVAPENKETIIYIVDFNKYSLYEACSWNAYATGDLVDGPLKHGLIHLTPENAILHAKALLSFTERKSND